MFNLTDPSSKFNYMHLHKPYYTISLPVIPSLPLFFPLAFLCPLPTPHTHLPLQSPVGLSQSLHLGCPLAPQRCNVHLLPLSHPHTITQCFILLSQLVQLTLQDIHPLSQFSYVPENVRARHISIWSRSILYVRLFPCWNWRLFCSLFDIHASTKCTWTLTKCMWAPL